MRDTKATISCRRRCRTTAFHWVSDSELGLGPASRGFTRAVRPGPTEMTLPPTALATETHSPLGSEATAAFRPNVMDRATSDFPHIDLPVPTVPITTIEGPLMIPLS